MSLLRRIEDACMPTPRNSYRPHLLRKHALALFLAAALVAEAYFVSGLLGVNPAQPFLAAAIESAGSVQVADWALGALAGALAALIALALARYTHMHPGEIVLPAAVVLGIVLALLALNAWYGGAYGIS